MWKALKAVLAVAALAAGLAGFDTAALATVNSAVIIPTQNLGAYDELTDISCPSATFCVAVGHSFDGSDMKTLIETWDGTDWAIAASPNQSGGSNYLHGVSCVDESFCVAVGNWAGNPNSALALAWDGSTWTPMTTANMSGPTTYGTVRENILNDVTCLSRTFCAAVGNWTASSYTNTLFESWNGTAWSITSWTDPLHHLAELRSITCFTTTTCMAVGQRFESETGDWYQSFSSTWNGSALTIIPAPSVPGFSNDMKGMSCVSPDFCVAVGTVSANYLSPEDQTFIWNGSAWASLPDIDHGGNVSLLNDVTCPTVSFCLAVGSIEGSQHDENLVEVWDGSVWSVLTTPQPNGGNGLSGVACTSEWSCLAVGWTDSGQQRTSLGLEFAGPIPPSTTTTSTTLPSTTSTSTTTTTFESDTVTPQFAG